jgi:hypothetical protein
VLRGGAERRQSRGHARIGSSNCIGARGTMTFRPRVHRDQGNRDAEDERNDDSGRMGSFRAQARESVSRYRRLLD